VEIAEIDAAAGEETAHLAAPGERDPGPTSPSPTASRRSDQE